MWPFRRKVAPQPILTPPARATRVVGLDDAPAAGGFAWGPPPIKTRADVFKAPAPLPGITLPTMAMDGMAYDVGLPLPISGWVTGGQYGVGLGFQGYPYLAEQTQRPEYRRGSEITAKEMTRKWLELKSTGEEDKSERIKGIMDDLERFRVQDVFRKAAEQDGFYGIGLIYVDTGASDNPAELRTELALDPDKMKKDSLKGFRIVEPIWTYPGPWNSTDPLHPHYYNPASWLVMSKEVHCSRLMRFVSRELPDVLKPAYQFGGLSLTQIAEPYVEDFLSTRRHIHSLVKSFSTPILKTAFDAMIQPGALQALINRLVAFNQARDNRGVFVIDKDTEEFANVTTPLTSLDALMSQAQERQATVWKTPLVVLFGITPTGMNASTDGEIRTWYDWIKASQVALFDANIRRVIDLIQLNRWGNIDCGIVHEWVPLWQLDEAGQAAVQKTKADTMAVLADAGAIGAEDIRVAVAADPQSPFHGLEGPPPEPPEMEDGPSTGGGEITAETQSQERQGV